MDIRKGYYVKLYYLPEYLDGDSCYLEGRVSKVEEDGFFVKGKGCYEFVKWESVVGYRLGKY